MNGRARQDGRRPRALRRPRGDGADGAQGRSADVADDAAHGPDPGDGRAGHRRRGAEHQSLLVQGRPRRRARADPHPERKARRSLRGAPRPVRRVRVGGAAASRSSPPSSWKKASRSTACAAPAIGGSVNGEDLSDPKFHPFWAKAEQLGVLVFIHPQGDGARVRSRSAAEGQRRARQRDRQPARDHDRALASDLRGHARPLSRAEDLRGARRRLPAVLRGPLRRDLRRRSPTGAPRRSRRSRPSTSGSSISTRSSSRPRRCDTWWPRRDRVRS